MCTIQKLMTALVCTFITISSYGQTDRITFKAPFVYPEGTAYYEKDHLFFVSSARTGTIGTVDMKGNYKEFYKDSTLRSSFGMKVDEKRGRLWVCTGDPNYSIYKTAQTFKKLIRVIALDLSSGEKLADIDLSDLYNGKHFANDLTLDNEGNIYVTDSFSPVVYKIDKNEKASVFVQSDLFKGEDIGLNGIAWNKKGFLLAAYGRDGAIFKITNDAQPIVTRVSIDQFFPGADGLLMNDKGNLILVQNKGVNKVFEISSDNDWRSAKVVAATALNDRFQNPSTATMQGEKIYALNSKLNELKDSITAPSVEFSLQHAVFTPVNK